jgi:hypothetical protein
MKYFIQSWRELSAAWRSSATFGIMAVLILSGCADVAETVSNPLPVRTAPQAPAQSFPADPRTTFAAAKAALGQMGFRFVRGGPAQGTLEAISDVGPGENPGSSHQYTLKAQFDGALDGKSTQVSVQMTEIIEDDTTHQPGFGTEAPLRDTALAESFFHDLAQQLAGSR